jgi:ribonuclease HII
MKAKYLIGIDEAGRGPLAGPVSLGAVSIPIKHLSAARKIFGKIKNSKHLSPLQRERWYRLMLAARQEGMINFACAYSSNVMIDTRGLSWSIRSALRRAINKLNCPPNYSKVRLDGSLKAPAEYLHQTTIIKGDEKEMIIAMASVVAKVRRDRLITRLSREYSGYGLEVHMGYGTAAHYKALRRLGPSFIHRRSFLGSLLRQNRK